MADLYRNSNDKWRAYGYQKAISTLKKCHRPVTTYEVCLLIFIINLNMNIILGNSNVTRYWFTFSRKNR